VQQHIFIMFDNLKFPEPYDRKFKEYAYQNGIGMELLRRIGGIYFRDICLEKFKMNVDDIDNHKKKQTSF
jgi:hypothetical protein